MCSQTGMSETHQLPPLALPNKIATPIAVTALVPLLAGYDIQLKNYVVNGLTNGFSIGCVGSRSTLDLSTRNLHSAYELPHITDTKLQKELELDRIMGPYETVTAGDKYRISPLGVIPKKTIGEFRMIQHLSFPYGESINDSIQQEFSSVQYANIQDAVKLITKTKNTVFMAEVDIESAFRIIPVSPADRPFLGFKWRDKFYMDAVLPMGCSSSCAIFEAFSSSLHWIAENKLWYTIWTIFKFWLNPKANVQRGKMVMSRSTVRLRLSDDVGALPWALDHCDGSGHRHDHRLLVCPRSSA